MSPRPTTNCDPKLPSAQRSLWSTLTSPLHELPIQHSPVHGVYDVAATKDQYCDDNVTVATLKISNITTETDASGLVNATEVSLENGTRVISIGSSGSNENKCEILMEVLPLITSKRQGQRKPSGGVSERATVRKNDENDEPHYCLCKKRSIGSMVACDNTECVTEWFHFKCVGLQKKPIGPWFCPSCRVDKSELDVFDSTSHRSPKRFKFCPVSTDWMRTKCAELVLPLNISRRKQRTRRTKTTLDSPPQKNMVKIIGDGNCLFRTLSHVICGSEQYHWNARKLVCDHIRQNGSRYAEHGSGDNYLSKSRMESNFVWGTDNEIQAAAELLHTTIWVYGPQVGRRAWMEFSPKVNNYDEAIFIVNRNYHFEPLYSWL